jgi:hypothetical protein
MQLGDEDINGIVANVMLGLPATLLGSWGKMLRAWIVDRRLWRLQHELARHAERPVAHAHARAVLRHGLIATLAADPVADGIWRTVMKPDRLGNVDVAPGDRVWLGLGSALAERPDDLQAAEALLFGGAWQSGTDLDTPHACPGRHLAVGALLGALAALLLAGELAPTASPTVLSLKPPPS